nr:hypothetical protein Iba_chr07dCG9630 [Ipomoea batatas]
MFGNPPQFPVEQEEEENCSEKRSEGEVRVKGNQDCPAVENLKGKKSKAVAKTGQRQCMDKQMLGYCADGKGCPCKPESTLVWLNWTGQDLDWVAPALSFSFNEVIYTLPNAFILTEKVTVVYHLWENPEWRNAARRSAYPFLVEDPWSDSTLLWDISTVCHHLQKGDGGVMGTLKQGYEEFSADATRFSLADAGGSLAAGVVSLKVECHPHNADHGCDGLNTGLSCGSGDEPVIYYGSFMGCGQTTAILLQSALIMLNMLEGLLKKDGERKSTWPLALFTRQKKSRLNYSRAQFAKEANFKQITEAMHAIPEFKKDEKLWPSNCQWKRRSSFHRFETESSISWEFQLRSFINE